MKRDKRFVIGMTAVLLTFCFVNLSCVGDLLPSSSQPPSEPPSPPSEYDATRSIVCLGDSLTAGMINYIDRPEKSWPARLQDKVTVTVVNAGISGDKTSDAIARLEKDVLSKNPQIVIIALGGNDLGGINMENFVDILETMETNLQKIIDRVKDDNRKLYLVNYLSAPFISAATEFPDEVAALIHWTVARIHSNLATYNNISLIEDLITEEMCNYISADGVHLDETGYEMAADIIFNAMKPFLLEHDLVR